MMRQSKALWCTLLLLLCTTHHALGYFVTVDAHSEECFFDKVSSGTKLGLTFEVVEGGFLDIDVKVGMHYIIAKGLIVTLENVRIYLHVGPYFL